MNKIVVICVVLSALICSCNPFKSYDSKLLPEEYSKSFKEVLRIQPRKDDAYINGGDYWQTPKETLARGIGDCEDLAFLLEYKLREKGLPVEIKFGKSYVTNVDNHAWCEVTNSNGDRIVLDPFQGWWKKNPGSDYYVVFKDLPLAIILKQIDYAIRLMEEK